jgi:hypothetical protein
MEDSSKIKKVQEEGYIKQAAKSSVFIYDGNTKPCEPPKEGEMLLPLGSGFIVGIEMEGSAESWRGWKFLITAEHVVSGKDKVIVRLNKKSGDSFTCYDLNLVRAGSAHNVFTTGKSEVDLVAINIPDIPETNPVIFNYDLIMGKATMEELEIQEGTEVFTVGYLYGYAGNKQNFPVTKFGRVALLTEEIWYRSPRNQMEQAYIIEMQNVPGLSGAPVMLLSPQFRVAPGNQFQFRNTPPFILGLIKGALKSPMGGSQGVAAVEPAEHLRQLLKSIADNLQKGGAKVKL